MRDRIFSSVELLVYVFDVADFMDMNMFNDIVEALDQHSRDAKVFVLLHKMDLVAEEGSDFISFTIILIKVNFIFNYQTMRMPMYA